MVKYVSYDNLKYFYTRLNERLNDMFTAGMHGCRSCGAPYKGKSYCEYCGRGFFVEDLMYKKEKQDNEICT